MTSEQLLFYGLGLLATVGAALVVGLQHRSLASVASLIVAMWITPCLAEQSAGELMRSGRETYEAGDWAACAEHYAQALTEAGHTAATFHDAGETHGSLATGFGADGDAAIARGVRCGVQTLPRGVVRGSVAAVEIPLLVVGVGRVAVRAGDDPVLERVGAELRLERAQRLAVHLERFIELALQP